MAKKRKKTKQKAPPCEECAALCCRYVAIELDEPETKEDYENIRWYLLHQNIKVFTNFDDEWFVEFVTDCTRLGADQRCTAYETRPSLCRSHGSDADIQCEFVDNPYNLLFKSVEEFEVYVNSLEV